MASLLSNRCANELKMKIKRRVTYENVLTLGEPQQLTIPKRNADFEAKSKGLCIFMKSLNLMDLALDKKNKTKQ
ncbi:hypothetical protein LCGC14_1478400 [marine sediment metagenome]|uniref:Uncharacterized protein n=1 Tax=marine sediment metagenome TaxID=412755 RepID=A0A0F9LQL7_9ZZZZ